MLRGGWLNSNEPERDPVKDHGLSCQTTTPDASVCYPGLPITLATTPHASIRLMGVPPSLAVSPTPSVRSRGLTLRCRLVRLFLLVPGSNLGAWTRPPPGESWFVISRCLGCTRKRPAILDGPELSTQQNVVDFVSVLVDKPADAALNPSLARIHIRPNDWPDTRRNRAGSEMRDSDRYYNL